MKKAAKFIGILLVCIVAAMAVAPLAFRGKIKEVVVNKVNQLINAEFGFDRLSISLFREFPQASVGIEGFWLRGKEVFAHDTLAYLGKVEVAVNLMSIFGNGGFDISKVLVEDTYLKAIVLEDGRANWDIMYPSEEEPEDTTTSSLRIVLKKVAADNVDITYDDRQAGMYAHIGGLGATCRGDMSADRALLDLQAAIEEFTFKMDGLALLNKANMTADIDIDADFANGVYTLQENTLSLNAIRATIDGWAALPADSPMSMDLQLGTSEISFKEILSLIPTIYTKDFEELKAEGEVSLHAYAKGELTDTTLPQCEVALKVSDGSFRYPALPAGIDDIQIAATVGNPGGDIDLTEIAIEQFSINMLGNPLAMTACMKTPISDPDLALTAKGTLDLSRVKDVFPLEDITLGGVFKADMSLGGRLSYVEKEQYERFSANGSLTLQDMQVQVEGIPGVAIEQSTFTFTPRYLDLSETRVLIGENDITADCRFEDYMTFALKGHTLRGQLNIKSNHMNINDFMGSGETEETAHQPATEEEATSDTHTEESGVIVVPKNIDFNMNVDMKEIVFDQIILNNLCGKLQVKDGTADMSNLSMSTMGGTVVMNGSYSTAKSHTTPELDASFALSDLSFAQTYKELNMVRQMAPIFEKLNGNFSGKIAVDTELDSTMSPNLKALTAYGSLNTRDLNLSGVEIIDKIADATGREELKNLSAKDLDIDFTIEEGRVHTKPFDLKIGTMNLNLSGTTGLDQTIDYTGKLRLPEGSSAIRTVDLKIGGKFSAPRVTVDTQGIVRQATEAIADKVLEGAKETVKEKFGLGIDHAEKQKAEWVESARQAAQRLVSEAEKQKSDLLDKAGNNAIKKLAAEKAGDALITKAKEQGDKLIAEAEEKGNELIEKVRKGEE